MSSLFLRRSWRPALFVAAEVVLYLSYRHHDARFHWFLHFFVGTSAALIAMAVLTYGSARPVRLPLLWLLTGHLIAMLPDILWNLQWLPYQPWMDVFLLHISAHFIPGRNWTWYVIFLVCLAVYLYARRAAEVGVQKHPFDAL
jgi:hypothetical protein